MADEPKTFAEQRVTEEVLSESDRIRKRITDYKAQLNPQSLGVIEVMLNQQLASGQTKPGDLDALILLRDDINKSSIEYRTQLENAQRRLAELAEQDAAEKIALEEAKITAIVDARDTERQRRKDAESRLAQVEAVLVSHGISMDLNADGVIGLAEGQVADELTAEEQEQVDNIVSVEKDNIAEIQQTALAQPVEPVEPKEPSRAFQMARMLNPEPEVPEAETEEPPTPTDEQMAAAQEMIEELEETDWSHEYQEDYGYDANGSPTTESPRIEASQSETTQLFQETHDWADNEDKERKTFEEWNEEQAQQVEEREHVLDVPEDAKGTEEFLKTVEEVEKTSNRTELADGVYIEEREVEETPSPSAPVITASQLPGDVKTFAETEDYPGETEEEYDEVTIPTESELKGMTKKTIHAEAETLNFDVPTSLTKTKMIESFKQQTEDLISSLQESGEFVSAETTDTKDSDDDDGDTDNIQDGGYF